MQPMRDLILIKADKPKSETTSGILLNEEWKTLPLEGEILAIGPTVTDFKVGDKVMFERYSSIVLPNDERLCKASHVFGTYNA